MKNIPVTWDKGGLAITNFGKNRLKTYKQALKNSGLHYMLKISKEPTEAAQGTDCLCLCFTDRKYINSDKMNIFWFEYDKLKDLKY